MIGSREVVGVVIVEVWIMSRTLLLEVVVVLCWIDPVVVNVTLRSEEEWKGDEG